MILQYSFLGFNVVEIFGILTAVNFFLMFLSCRAIWPLKFIQRFLPVQFYNTHRIWVWGSFIFAIIHITLATLAYKFGM